jgi:hypothetical protein
MKNSIVLRICSVLVFACIAVNQLPAQVAQFVPAKGIEENQILKSYVTQGKSVEQLHNEVVKKSGLIVTAVTDTLGLTEQQSLQLDFACAGDIERFFQDLEEVHLHTAAFDMQKMNQNQQEFQKLWPLIMPIRQRFELGLHSKGSMFEKALKHALSKDQQQKYEEHLLNRQKRFVTSLAKLTLLEFEKQVPLSKAQRDKILELVEKSKKPKNTTDGMAHYVGLVILAKLPKAQMMEILTEDQYKQFTTVFANADRFGGIQW